MVCLKCSQQNVKPFTEIGPLNVYQFHCVGMHCTSVSSIDQDFFLFLYNFQLTINLLNIPPAFLPDCQSIVSCDTDIIWLWPYQVHCHFSSYVFQQPTCCKSIRTILLLCPPFLLPHINYFKRFALFFFFVLLRFKTVNENENEQAKILGS